MNLDEQRQRTAAASGCWLMAGAAYLILEAVAAAAYRPDYSYAHNYISDLGRPSRQSAGATIGSGFASAMNAAFYLQGILFLVGAVLLVRARRKPNARAFLNLVAVNTLGNIVVGTVYSGPPADAGGPAWVHAGGAVMAIVGGNAAVLAGFRCVRSGALVPRRLTRAWCPRPGQLPDAGCSDDHRVVYRAHRDVGTDERVYDHRLADAVGGRPAHVAIR